MRTPCWAHDHEGREECEEAGPGGRSRGAGRADGGPDAGRFSAGAAGRAGVDRRGAGARCRGRRVDRQRAPGQARRRRAAHRGAPGTSPLRPARRLLRGPARRGPGRPRRPLRGSTPAHPEGVGRRVRDGTRPYLLRPPRRTARHRPHRRPHRAGLLRQDTGFALTDAGLRWFADLGIRLDRTGRRPLTRACLDWTERRPHLAGTAGAALCRHALDARWCVRIGSERAVRVTPEGEHHLARLLGIEATALR